MFMDFCGGGGWVLLSLVAQTPSHPQGDLTPVTPVVFLPQRLPTNPVMTLYAQPPRSQKVSIHTRKSVEFEC